MSDYGLKPVHFGCYIIRLQPLFKLSISAGFPWHHSNMRRGGTASRWGKKSEFPIWPPLNVRSLFITWPQPGDPAPHQPPRILAWLAGLDCFASTPHVASTDPTGKGVALLLLGSDERPASPINFLFTVGLGGSPGSLLAISDTMGGRGSCY